MKHQVKAPSVGESITEVSILKWAKQNGQQVKAGDLLLEIESDKATVEIVAEASGQLTILKQAGDRMPVGELIGIIDDAATGSVSAAPTTGPMPPPLPGPAALAPATMAGAPPLRVAPPALPPAAMAMPGRPAASLSTAMPGPAARKALAEAGLDAGQVPGTGKDGRVTSGDVSSYKSRPTSAPP